MFETGNLMNLHVDGPSVNIAPLRARLRSLESEFEKIFDEAVHACSHVFPPSTGKHRAECEFSSAEPQAAPGFRMVNSYYILPLL